MRSGNSTARRRFCAACGGVVRPGLQSCISCGGISFTLRWIKPTKKARIATITPAFPWHRIEWPEGVTVAISAGYGVGKSSAAALLGLPGNNGEIPILRNWITTEQDPNPVRRMFERLGVQCPQIWAADPLNPLESVKRAIRSQTSGPGALTVLDSTTPLGIDGAVEVMNLVVQNCLATGRRALLISQQNKQKEILGKVALAFIPDIVLNIDVDGFGRRRLVVEKNRHGAPATTYFEFSEEGKIQRPDFTEVAHSVEGVVGDYQLVPHGLPMRNIKWAGLLDALDLYEVLPTIAGRATAAIQTGATSCGFLAPPDLRDRKALAEDHGLRWLGIEEGVQLLDAARKEAEEKELEEHEPAD
jgi:hypothetical protein